MKHLAIIAALSATPAFGQSTCAERDALVAVLTDTYGEAQRMIALNGDQIVEFWGNEEADTWTMLASYAGGVTCILAAGEGFAIVGAQPPGEAM